LSSPNAVQRSYAIIFPTCCHYTIRFLRSLCSLRNDFMMYSLITRQVTYFTNLSDLSTQAGFARVTNAREWRLLMTGVHPCLLYLPGRSLHADVSHDTLLTHTRYKLALVGCLIMISRLQCFYSLSLYISIALL